MDLPTESLEKTIQTWIVYIFRDTTRCVNRGDIREKIIDYQRNLSLLLGKVLPITAGNVPHMQPHIPARPNAGTFEIVLP